MEVYGKLSLERFQERIKSAKRILETPTTRRNHFRATRLPTPGFNHTFAIYITEHSSQSGHPQESSMSATVEELNDIFAIPPVNELSPEILGELQSICRLHSISPKELSYKWESYSIKMGSDQTKLDLATARAFKKDLQEIVEREARSKSHVRSADRRGAYATPRNAAKGGDAFGMYVRVELKKSEIAHQLQA